MVVGKDVWTSDMMPITRHQIENNKLDLIKVNISSLKIIYKNQEGNQHWDDISTIQISAKGLTSR